MCKDQVLRHQNNAKKLWKQHTEQITKKQGSPGPGEYLHVPNMYQNSFTGEGGSTKFGTGPRLPATVSLYDRTIAMHR